MTSSTASTAPNRGTTVLGTNAGSFKAKVNTAPGDAAALTQAAVEASDSAEDAARSTSVLVNSYADTAAAWNQTVERARHLLAATHKDYDEIRETQARLRSLAIRHAQTERGADEVRADADAFEYDPSSAERYITLAAQRRAEGSALADLGYGHNAQGVAIARVRRDLVPGTQIEVQFLRAHLGGGLAAPEQRTVARQTSHQMISTRPDGTAVHNHWGQETAYLDDAGHYIICDAHGDPFVAYRMID